MNYLVVNELQDIDEIHISGNTFVVSEDVIVGNKLNRTMFTFPIGLTFYLSQKLYVDAHFQLQYYPKGKNDYGFIKIILCLMIRSRSVSMHLSSQL